MGWVGNNGRQHLMTLDTHELTELSECYADELRDLMEIGGEGSGDPEYWTDTHDPERPMPPRPANRTAWRRYDRRMRDYERWLGAIDAEADRRGIDLTITNG